MGIPSYFSHLVRNHKACVQELDNKSVDNLYLDANSIIYDCLHRLESSEREFTEEQLIMAVFDKIWDYIKLMNPTKSCFIAFDGVAPLAKLKQQRNRRYKSSLEKNINNKIHDTNKNKWDTCAITPGTPFMSKLNDMLRKAFETKRTSIKITLSGSNVPGEGEHKIFEHIRNNADYHKGTNSIIYGLDADLIMLSLNHLHISETLFLSRETPHFINQIDEDLEPDKLYKLNIPELKNAICDRLVHPTRKLDKNDYVHVINDYILLCFMLGNDFLPHFPSLNIRTNGIDILLDTYKKYISPTNSYLTDGDSLNWKNIKKVVKPLADNERTFIIEEYKHRTQMESRFLGNKTTEQLEKKFLLLPTIERNVERYINPYEQEWQERYYKKLFDLDYTETNIRDICINYLEGLEWTKTYYHNNCKNWRWHYKYNYPPLLEDLIRYIPIFSTEFVRTTMKNPITPLTQLSYVLPYDSLHMLPNDKREIVMDNLSHLYKKNLRVQWSFCKYFWESHIIFPDISIESLEALLGK